MRARQIWSPRQWPTHAQRDNEATPRPCAGAGCYLSSKRGVVLRFAVARVEVPGDAVLAALLLVGTQAVAAKGLTSRNLCLTLLAKVEELVWPI
jgi:hypothetical protein